MQKDIKLKIRWNLDKKKINFYQNEGVVILNNIINEYWIEKLKKGVKKNFSNPSKFKCVYERIK